MIITEFPRYGRLLATHPLKSIGICLLIPALSALGLMKYQTENNPYKLWIPQVQHYNISLSFRFSHNTFQDSDYLRNHEWLWSNFPPDIRFHSVIVSSEENILTPDTLRLVSNDRDEVLNRYSTF